MAGSIPLWLKTLVRAGVALAERAFVKGATGPRQGFYALTQYSRNVLLRHRGSLGPRTVWCWAKVFLLAAGCDLIRFVLVAPIANDRGTEDPIWLWERRLGIRIATLDFCQYFYALDDSAKDGVLAVQ